MTACPVICGSGHTRRLGSPGRRGRTTSIASGAIGSSWRPAAGQAVVTRPSVGPRPSSPWSSKGRCSSSGLGSATPGPGSGPPRTTGISRPGRTCRAGGGPADAGDLRPALGDTLDHPRGYRHGEGPHRPGRGPPAGIHARPARRAPRAGDAAVPGRGRRPGIGRTPMRDRPLGAAGPCEDQVCRRIGSRGPMGFDPDQARRRGTGHLDEETP